MPTIFHHVTKIRLFPRVTGVLRLAVPRLAVVGFAVLGLAGLGSTVAIAQEGTETSAPDDQSMREKIALMVESLDSNQLARRQQAERDLIALGPDALDLLPEIDGRLAAEAQLRLRRVVQALQEARAEQSAKAQNIRLGNVATVEEALTRLSDLSGVQFFRPEAINRPVQLSLGAQPFWPTLDALLDAADLDINFYVGEPGQIGLVERQEGRRRRTDSAAYAGVYRLETTAVTARRDLRSPALSGLSISSEISWEPRLTPIGLNLPLESVTAILDDGQRIKPEAGQIDVSAGSTLPFSEFSIRLPLPTGSPRTIETLTGTIRSMLPGAREHFKIPLGNKHDPETVGNVTFWVEDVRANGTLFEIRIEVIFENAGNAFESHRQWVFENPAYVMTASGKRLEHLGLQTYRQTPDRVGIGYLFDLGEKVEGNTFHYQTPISIIENEVDFVMKDITLP
jgi:hypothetical protein